MTDNFSIIPLNQLLQIILNQYESSNKILNIPKDLFFVPRFTDTFRSKRFGQLIETPIGVAAGPQTQLTQNIIASWLTGARFIELKTIQTLDELEISKPCIDMQDEGYNCEWSQELKVKESFDQYLDAWIIIHILRDKFNWAATNEVGVIFNMSVGYDYEGIKNDNIQWFFGKMADASVEIKEKIESIKLIYPNIVNLDINPQISNNITLSTMHGCPPEEIEKIGEYLIEEKKLHTAIKLNPTLIGKEVLMEIMDDSGFNTSVPELAFEHDLEFDDAIGIISRLQKKADNNNIEFSVKLTNTLESQNNKEVFSEKENMMYMSGRALHPISVKLAHKLQNKFKGNLDISFSGGANAFNIVDIINCGLSPVTVCTDLLKPGGYSRLFQYIQNLRENNCDSNSKGSEVNYLEKYASNVTANKDYKKSNLNDQNIKTQRQLNSFDCIKAPCIDSCPTNQGIPDYMYYASKGDFQKAADIILQTNPFPHTTGMVCDHLCQTKCTRINYDSPVLIREIKRFISENSEVLSSNSSKELNNEQKIKASIIGAGPSGLSCAYFLAKAGIEVTIYESKPKAGGMVSAAIPSFRLSYEAIDIDINNIIKLGVKIIYNSHVDKALFTQLREQSDFIYIGAGAMKSKKLQLQNNDISTALDPLDFLYKVKKGEPTNIGKNVVIIGGGNTAMDAARTAYRLVGINGKVTIVYRRSIKQMPADLGEIKAVLEEGIEILELSSPIKLNTKNGKPVSLLCSKMKLGPKDSSGRARPVDIPNSEFEIYLDTIIPAIGQETDIEFATSEELKTLSGKYETTIKNVFIGGDSLRGASTAINAIGDGRKAAQEIINKLGIELESKPDSHRNEQNTNTLLIKRTQRFRPENVLETSLDDRQNFKMVSTTLSQEEAISEASRCILCDEICNICTTVCPNLAFHGFDINPVSHKTQKIISTKKGIEIISGQDFSVKQKHQILHIADWCNKCGNCDTFCPTSGSPYLEKPHLYLKQEEFEKEKDGYFLKNDDIPTLLFYHKKQQLSFKKIENNILVENNNFTIKLEVDSLDIVDIQSNKNAEYELDLAIIAEMNIIYEGSLSFFNYN